MKFNNPLYEKEELTYEDVFLFQKYFEGISRLDINIQPQTILSTNIPIVTANMNAVTGKRMAETIARYGGLGVLPQDMDIETLRRIIAHIKHANTQYDTPITVKPENTIRDAMGIMHKRSHNRVIMIDEQNKPIGIFSDSDFKELDQYSLLKNIPQKRKCITAKTGTSDEEAYTIMDEAGISSLPIVDESGVLIGILTQKNTIRNSVYNPTLDKNGSLDVCLALGINNFEEKAKVAYDLGIRTFVLDTAHGYQKKMIDSIKKMKTIFGKEIVLIAGNVITKEATESLIKTGADGVKVGIGPGAMCTTRIKTGVGRPQFTAVHECSKMARSLGGFVWADGGIKQPRDLALALAAGASHIMIGSLLTGTYESTGDIKYDELGRMYKENYGMASKKAVNLRNQKLSKFDQEKKQMFREGISTSKIYLKKGYESVGDIVDDFIAGLRSAMTYVGASTLEDFYKEAIIGVQTSAGFQEGTPHGKLIK